MLIYGEKRKKKRKKRGGPSMGLDDPSSKKKKGGVAKRKGTALHGECPRTWRKGEGKGESV